MKLASLDGGREARLFVVSDDLGWCVSAAEIAPTMRAAQADWGRCEPLLRGVAAFLNRGGQRYVRFEPADGSARTVFAVQGPVEVRRGAAVIVGAVAKGCGRAEAVAAVRLVMLELDCPKGAARSPVAVTVESLGEAWRDGRFSGAPALELDGDPVAESPIVLDFAGAIVEAARTDDVAEGSVISLSDPRPVRLASVADGAVLRYELRDALSRSTFGAVELRAKVLAPAVEMA
jgi:fumarylacetoacetate (FAA) hydrolase